MLKNGAKLSTTYADDEHVGEFVDARALELGLAAVHHELRVSSGEQDEPEAPRRVAQHAAAQQHLVVVQRVRLLAPRHHALELAQHVVRRLALHLR